MEEPCQLKISWTGKQSFRNVC